MSPDTHMEFPGLEEPIRNLPAELGTMAVLLDQDAMLVVGFDGQPLPETAEVLFADAIDRRGAWRGMSWIDVAAPSGRYPFVGILRVEDIVRMQAMPMTLAVPGTDDRIALPAIGRIELDAAPLFDHLQHMGADLAAIFDFLRRALLSPPSATASRRIRRFLVSILDGISKHDGFVEALGRPDCGGLFIQGWSVHLKPGLLDIAVLDTGFEIDRAVAASFERRDLLATARGVVVFVKDAAAANLEAVERVYFRSPEGYFHLDIADTRALLNGADSLARLKDMLGKLEADPVTARALKRAGRGTYTGHDTVSTLARPVRMACEVALHAEDTGLFVAGWLVDPQRAVARVLLRSTAGFSVRIDDAWARLPRRDVAQSVSADPAFAGKLREDDAFHGFLAFVPQTDAAAGYEDHYLEIVLDDESCVFLPVRCESSDPAHAMRRLLATVSPDEPLIDSIIAAHVGPMALGLSAGRRPSAASETRMSFGPTIHRPEVSAIIPLVSPCADFDVNLARLAGDEDLRRAELTIVTARPQADAVAALLRRCGPFYGLGGTLVIADGPIDRFDALELGARHASSELLLLLSPTVLPIQHGWLSRLVASLRRAPVAGMVSPTLLYEDDSVRYAGAEDADVDPIAPPARFAGYSRHWLKSTELTAVRTATTLCALLPRQLFLGLGGFSRSFVGPEFKGIDFTRRIGAKGARCYWAADTALYALDEPNIPAEDAPSARIGRLVDRWAFESKWPTRLIAAAAE